MPENPGQQSSGEKGGGSGRGGGAEEEGAEEEGDGREVARMKKRGELSPDRSAKARHSAERSVGFPPDFEF